MVSSLHTAAAGMAAAQDECAMPHHWHCQAMLTAWDWPRAARSLHKCCSARQLSDSDLPAMFMYLTYMGKKYLWLFAAGVWLPGSQSAGSLLSKRLPSILPNACVLSRTIASSISRCTSSWDNNNGKRLSDLFHRHCLAAVLHARQNLLPTYLISNVNRLDLF